MTVGLFNYSLRILLDEVNIENLFTTCILVWEMRRPLPMMAGEGPGCNSQKNTGILLLNNHRVPPGNRLEALRGDRKGQNSIHINDQYRICFIWVDIEPDEVEIADYH